MEAYKVITCGACGYSFRVVAEYRYVVNLGYRIDKYVMVGDSCGHSIANLRPASNSETHVVITECERLNAG